MTIITSVSDNDVLCGRGGATNNHVGNRRFRQLVATHQSNYLVAKKRDKKLIARSIVESIRGRGGRFLKKEDADINGEEHWVDVGDKKASEKTSQALREGLDVRATKVSRDKASRESKNIGDSSSSAESQREQEGTAAASSSSSNPKRKEAPKSDSCDPTGDKNRPNKRRNEPLKINDDEPLKINDDTTTSEETLTNNISTQSQCDDDNTTAPSFVNQISISITSNESDSPNKESSQSPILVPTAKSSNIVPV